jgi:hypothetical protein
VNFKELGIEPSRQRRVYACDCPTFEAIVPRISVKSPRFVLLVAADVGTLAEINATLTRLLDSGCVYLCAWGPGCEILHDAMDDVVVDQELAGAPESTVMTTWHSRETLAEAVEFALLWAVPDAALAEGCDSVVLASVGNATWAGEIVRTGASHVRRSVI